MQAVAAGNWPKPPVGLFSWGSNGDGQLGLNNLVYYSSPVQVGALSTWSQIAGGAAHTIAAKTDGTLWSWGKNTPQGQLGLNDTVSRSSPVQIGALTTWYQVAAGGNFTLATKTDGTLWSWGFNTTGALGLGNAAYRSSPVQVGALTTWYQVAAGLSFTIASKTDGTLWSWGNNSYGQLGLNDTVSRSSPVQIGALTTWYQVAAGGYQTFAIKTDGTLWSWGFNNYAQLGLNIASGNRSSPVQIGALTTWSQVAGGKIHTLATKTDGTLWCWGYNSSGQLGLGDTTNRSSPVQVGALTAWSQVAGGESFSFSIKTDGTLWSWGSNGSGRLGINLASGNRSSPVQVGSLTTWLRLPKMPMTPFSVAIKG
jgi:alpha-tubulin suppressor-like RCC1 family protein